MTGDFPEPKALLSFPPHELTRISADALKSWSRCRRQFVYKHVARLQWPSDVRHFSLGREVHKLLDYQSRGLDCSPLLPDADIKVRRVWDKLMADHEKIVHWEILASEWEFHVPITLPGGKVEWLTGRMDRISRDDHGKVWIIDWKTGMGVPKNAAQAWQTRLYLFALLELATSPSAVDLNLGIWKGHAKPLTADSLGFLYVEIKADSHSPIRTEDIPYNHAKHEETRQILVDTLSAMAVEEDYPLPSQCPDKHCIYRSLCGMPMP